MRLEETARSFDAMIFEQLYPNKVITSVYELNWEQLAEKYSGVMFDIDNTLVPHDAPADDRAKALFQKIHGLGMKTMLVSNNGEARVQLFAKALETDYVYKAGKPKKGGYEKAMERMGTNAANTLFIGDQIFTDIWGANRTGVDTMLTEPVDPSTDEIQIVIKRWFEKPFRMERR
jgi:hypothetical protein